MPRDFSNSRLDTLPPADNATPPIDPASEQPQPPAPAKFPDRLPASTELIDSADCSTSPQNDTATVLSSQKAREAVTRLLDGKEQEWTAVAQKQGPLRLLDLPVDVLSEIVKEVTHTNDLAALALTHSALHALAIPQIYSRFDIVWPDSNVQSEPRAGVDALTYGLATLVMAEDVFNYGSATHNRGAMSPSDAKICGDCGQIQPYSSSIQSPSLENTPRSRRKRRGNYYAQFTRKFSLGNGPADWVQEYMITKEGGKMLGTLVALAVARMVRLEAFIWDMPTGILQDVWDALASLGERSAGKGCRLEKVWVRWHNSSKVEGNYEAPMPPPRNRRHFWRPYSAGLSTAIPERYLSKRNRVDRPTFSALPPLKSLSVLDIDECAYLDEMSQLIAKSNHSLRELRVGIAEHAVGCEWAYPWMNSNVGQHPKDISLLGTSHWEGRLGGVIGVLLANTFDIRHNLGIMRKRAACDLSDHPAMDSYQISTLEMFQSSEYSNTLVSGSAATPTAESLPERGKGMAPKFTEDFESLPRDEVAGAMDAKVAEAMKLDIDDMKPINKRLSVEVLELERVALCPQLLIAAFDWHTIRELTILSCPGNKTLWNCLRSSFGPCASSRDERRSCSELPFQSIPKKAGRCLRLRKIHTNTVTAALIQFIKDLEPNTLEVLFLQQSLYHKSKVNIQSIMQAVRHHRRSLKKLLIDSSERDAATGEMTVEGWQKWMLDREMVWFISSGRMPKLRELAVAMDNKDWHLLLQRLPRIPHLRSLNLPFIACDRGKTVENNAARERALQVIDIITLRQEIELCYIGIAGKCFEVLESRVLPESWKHDDHQGNHPRNSPSVDDEEHPQIVTGPAHAHSDEAESGPEEDEDDFEAEEGADDDDDDDDVSSDYSEESRDQAEGASVVAQDGSCWTDDEDDTSSLDEPRLWYNVREILFYDDKVAIFKARHGRL